MIIVNMTYRRRFGFLLFCAGMALVCSGLSFWQWQRLDEKTALLAALSAQTVITPALADWAEGKNLDAYRLVTLTGVVDPRQPFFRAAAVNPNGGGSERIGYDLWLPVVVGDGLAVMVNYGWVDAGMRDHLIASAASATQFSQSVTGWWVPKKSPGLFTPANNIKKNQWFYPNIAELAMASSYRLAPGMVYNQLNWFGGIRPPITANIPNNHRQYAWTWALLALVNVAGGLYFGLGGNKHHGRSG